MTKHISKKLIIISFLVLISIIGFVSIYKNIGKYDNPIMEKVKNIVPQTLKDFLKTTLFASRNQQILKDEILDIDERLKEKIKLLGDIPNILGYVPFTKVSEDTTYKINDTDYILSKFKSNIFL